jgi:hypothetical protein
MGLYRQRDGSQLTEHLHPLSDATLASTNFTGFRDRLNFPTATRQAAGDRGQQAQSGRNLPEGGHDPAS